MTGSQSDHFIRHRRVAHGSLQRVLALVGLGIFISFHGLLAAAPVNPPRVLILSQSVSAGGNTLEAQVANALGYKVDVITPAQWASMTTPSSTTPQGFKFNDYRAIIVNYENVDSAYAEANRAVWNPLVTGNVIIIGGDPENHAQSHPGAAKLIQNSVAFAADDPNKTGLYLCLGSRYSDSPPFTPLPVLNALGAFSVRGTPCYGAVHIVATHPALAGLMDGDLANWGCSAHESFDTWPGNFLPLTIALDFGSSYTAFDGTVGTPYILVRGDLVRALGGEIALGPDTAANHISTTHTVCATVITNGVPAVGLTVTFTVVTGPNAGVTGTAVTDANGVACFTYTGTGGTGSDFIRASFINVLAVTQTSNMVRKDWIPDIALGPLEATNPTNTPHTVCATVATNGIAIAGTTVTFTVVSGPNAGVTGTAVTDVNGVACFTYSGLGGAGTDAIIAQFVDFLSVTQTSNQARKFWLIPCVICPTNQTVLACSTNAQAFYGPAANNCPSNTVITFVPPSGSIFPLGSTTVACIASNSIFGALTNCTFTVTVQAVSPILVIHCPADIVAYACSNSLQHYTPTVTDNCCSNQPPVVFCTPTSPHLFPLGTTTVHCEVTNCLGNTASCDFHVTVLQTNVTPPTILCSSNKTVVAPVLDYRTLWSFLGPAGDGQSPYPRLIEGSDGLLYGATEYGGSNNVGTVFKLNTDGTGYTVLHHFSSSGGNGSLPADSLLEGFDGALYGTTAIGGSNNMGTVFTLNTDGTGYTVLHHFSSAGGDGRIPASALVQGIDGKLYGTTAIGGTNNMGTAFTLNTDGTGYAVLKRFTGSDGQTPHAGLLQGTNGALYGTTVYGGSNGVGTVYALGSNGTGYVVLYNFASDGVDGQYPEAGLLEGSDGSLYGTTRFGGTNGAGTVFKLNKDGSGYAVLKSFTGADGNEVLGALAEGDDGALYGTTVSGGSNDLGTIFTLQMDGSGFTELYDLPSGGEGGQEPPGPYAGLLKGSDGAFYGTTPFGGSNGVGSVSRFEWSPPWDFDSPTIYDEGGGTNVVIDPLSTTTNGPCPQIVVRTWRVTDECGNSVICTQLVTVLPPRKPIQLFNTGRNLTGQNLQPIGTADPHYTLILNPNGGGSTAWVMSQRPTFWVNNNAFAQWIGPSSNSVSPEGTYVYRLTFNLPCTNRAAIRGQWAADDGGNISVNGTPVPGGSIGVNTATMLHSFAVTSGFVPGANVLEFQVFHTGGYAGLWVKLTGTASCCTNCLSIQCPSNIVVTSCTNLGIAYSAAVTAGCASNFPVQYTPPSGSQFAPGTTTTVHSVVTDTSGNSATCDFTVTVVRPQVGFTGSPTNGVGTVAVGFFSSWPCDITNWHWTFGDGGTISSGTASNPVHTYSPGTFTVTLAVSGLNGDSTNIRPNYITVLTSFQAWQLQYFNCTNCLQAAGDADPDGDGMSNTNEFLAGTNPTNSLSALRIVSVVRQLTNVVITWATAGGVTNAVQATGGGANGSYSTNSFTDISGLIHISGSGDASTNYVDPGGATNAPSRYYRIRLAP